MAPARYEPVVAEFLRYVRMVEPIFRSIRARTLFADRGSGNLVPVATRIHLLPETIQPSTRRVWHYRYLKVSEKNTNLQSVESLLTSLLDGSFEVDAVFVGFREAEEPKWEFQIHSQAVNRSDLAESSKLVLKGTIAVDNSPRGDEPHFLNELQANPRSTYSSISDMTENLLGRGYSDLRRKEIEISVPTYARLVDSSYRRNVVSVRIRCREEVVPRLKLWAIFRFPDGHFHEWQPRFRTRTTARMDDGSVEIRKNFVPPREASTAQSVRITLSAGGDQGLALDSKDSIHCPANNAIRAVLDSLDTTRVGKYFDMNDFEAVLTHLSGGNEDRIFESLVATTLASCGFSVAYSGGFGLSCEDMLAFVPGSHSVLVVECTVGSPIRKIGLMKTALSSLREEIDWLTFHGIVITSNYSSEPEKDSALRSNVTLLDVSDLKALVQMTSEAPNPEEAMRLFGIH